MPVKKIPAPFQRLRRDHTYGGFAANLVHNGRKIRVQFHAESREQLEPLLPAAAAFWRSRARWFKAFREYAATELLAELNANLDCGQDDFQEVTAAQLRKGLRDPFTLQFMADEESGQVVFEMDGGENKQLLQENCFEVFGTLEQGITSGGVVTLL